MILHVLLIPDCVDDASPRDEEESLIGIEMGVERFMGDFAERKELTTHQTPNYTENRNQTIC
jgi:hypothetical protein